MVFGLFKRWKRGKNEGDGTVWSADPTRSDLKLIRRWGVMTVTRQSDEQFNLYELENGYLVTMQMRDGAEVEQDGTGLFKGGQCQSIDEAYGRAASYLSDLIYASAMVGGSCLKIVIVNTTPGTDPCHLSTLEHDGHGVSEKKHNDP